jgi:hypothetical protein
MDHKDMPLRTPVNPPRTSRKAITSLVLGIASFLCNLFTGIPAILFGAFALNDINQSRGQLTGRGMAITGIVTGSIGTVIMVPAILVALLLPAIQAAREAARRNQSMNQLKQISIGLQIYETARMQFPAAGNVNAPAAGGRQLSWRVHILPYVEETVLYEQFHLDEPWDSEHNLALAKQTPFVYQDPNGRLPPGHTAYLAVTGPQTAFGDGKRGPQTREITDGVANTIFIVEVDPEAAVPWTKPDDYVLDPNDPTRGLGNGRFGGFLGAFGDGSVQFFSEGLLGPSTIKDLMTATGGEAITIRPGL